MLHTERDLELCGIHSCGLDFTRLGEACWDTLPELHHYILTTTALQHS